MNSRLYRIHSVVIVFLSLLFHENLSGQQFQTAYSLGSNFSDRIMKSVNDHSGNIILTGQVTDSVDFDFGAGVHRVSVSGSVGSSASFVCKQSPNLDFLWVITLSNPYSVQINDIKSDDSNCILVLGYFTNTADFDPGVGVANLVSKGNKDAFLLKLDSNGGFLWVKQFGGTGEDDGKAVAFDAAGNILIAGEFTGTVDLNPGVGVNNVTSLGATDIFICKLSPAGEYLNGKRDGNLYADAMFDLSVDLNGNLVTLHGSPNSPAVVKYNSSMNLLWSRQLGGANCYSKKVLFDKTGNVYVGGHFYATMNNIPGLNLMSNGVTDLFYCKLNSNGNLIWAKSIGGGSTEELNDLKLGDNGELYSSGIYGGGQVDFDPGSAVYYLYNQGHSSGFYNCLDSNGSFIYAKAVQNIGNYLAYGMSVCFAGNDVLCVGYFAGTVDVDPGKGIQPLTSAGNTDGFLVRSCNFHVIPMWNESVCLRESLNLSANSIPNAIYAWTGPNSFASNSRDNTIVNGSAIHEGVYTLSVNSNGCIASDTIIVSFQALPPINTYNNSPVCEGKNIFLQVVNPSVGTQFLWTGPNNYSHNGGYVNLYGSPANSGNYLLKVTGSNGCYDSVVMQAVVNPKPIISITASSSAICSGDSVVLKASGADSYTWNNNVLDGVPFYPTSTQSYMVEGVDSNKCAATASKMITVHPTPASSITSTDNSRCSGNCNGSATISVTGGTTPFTYQWSNGALNKPTADQLCEGEYQVQVSDYRGCKTSQSAFVKTVSSADSRIYMTNLAAVDQKNVSPAFAAFYAYNLPTSISPHPSNPRNFVDPGKKARFKVECTNQQSNGQSIVSGICKVRSNNPYIFISDSSSALNNIAWNDKAWSADEFEIDIDQNIAPGTNAYIDFIVEENGIEYATTCIAVPVSPLVYTPTTALTIDDDNNPDSRGNDNDKCEPDEIIEFYPWLNNVSELNAEYVRGRFENLDNHAFIDIWNNKAGVNTTVYDATWWNYSFAKPQMVPAGSRDMKPEFDFVFDYKDGNASNEFKLYLVMAGGFNLFNGSALSLVQWSLPYSFNGSGGSNSITDNSGQSGIRIYPNPTQGVFQIQVEGEELESIEVFDNTGKSLISKSVGSGISLDQVDLSNCAKGLYLVKIRAGGVYYGQKVLLD